MGEQSKIQWTDATWNPVRGCTKISPGCAHCYAEAFAERFRGVKGHPYEQGFDLKLVPEKLEEPLRWRRPRMVFVNSMSDLFQAGVPDEFVADVFGVMALAKQHTFQVLTKRPEMMRRWIREHTSTDGKLIQYIRPKAGDWAAVATHPMPLPNVWLGVSVENQHFADERIPILLDTPAALRFISAEPLLGPIDLWGLRGGTFDPLTGCGDRERLGEWEDTPRLDWVIAGGESGEKARPCDTDWIRDIIGRCSMAKVPCFVKQLGAWPATGLKDYKLPPLQMRQGGRFKIPPFLTLNDAKGGNPAEWPADLRVREMPERKAA